MGYLGYESNTQFAIYLLLIISLIVSVTFAGLFAGDVFKVGDASMGISIGLFLLSSVLAIAAINNFRKNSSMVGARPSTSTGF